MMFHHEAFAPALSALPTVATIAALYLAIFAGTLRSGLRRVAASLRELFQEDPTL